MMRLVARSQTLEDPAPSPGSLGSSIAMRLQPPRQRAILLDVLELLVRRRADDAELTRREHRLDQRREVHRAARRGAGTDGGVDLVDEQDRHRPLRERVDHRLEALLEVSAEARAREQRAGVEREHLGALEQIRDVVLQQPRRETFGERRLADAGVADEHRVVLAPAAEDLHRPLQLVGAADERIELAGARPRRQVGRVRRQRIARRGAAAFTRVRLPRPDRRKSRLVPWRRRRHLGDPVRDELRDVEPRDRPAQPGARRRTTSAAAAWPRARRLTALPGDPALWTCSTAVCSTRRKASVCSGSFADRA